MEETETPIGIWLLNKINIRFLRKDASLLYHNDSYTAFATFAL